MPKNEPSISLASLAILGLVSGCAESTRADQSKGSSAKPATAPSGSAAPDASSHKNCCKGKNDCKAKGGCGTDQHDCAGKNDCKGKGGCSMRKCD